MSVLLVEDDPEDAALTIRALKRHNLTNHVQHAADGAEALDILRYADVEQLGRCEPGDMFACSSDDTELLGLLLAHGAASFREVALRVGKQRALPALAGVCRRFPERSTCGSAGSSWCFLTGKGIAA